ncbi:MAG: holo-ACP synthase [Proteobacteria bacterium]|nr:holo-ACP synthase [Pseudomonadota bacterium]
MIIGIGEDTCDIRRIEKALKRHGQRFMDRCFTPEEQAKAARRKSAREPASTLAKRFAAKEACAKALGTGFNMGVSFRSIGVVNAPSGAPALVLAEGTLKQLQTLTPAGKTVKIHVTLGDEYPYAKALVIIECLDA